jgi:hypothetical protein
LTFAMWPWRTPQEPAFSTISIGTSIASKCSTVAARSVANGCIRNMECRTGWRVSAKYGGVYKKFSGWVGQCGVSGVDVVAATVL